MEKWLKYFPLLPKEKDTTTLVTALLFYLFVPSIAYSAVTIVLGVTVIFAAFVPVLALVALAYTVVGIILSILRYSGKEIK